ncbi:nicotinate-nucleotide--dimethylbenzimidazole phosphoribosyltransferase [Treponema endosymbiont of Eucomonympha sp.]|uniref:nicotinate-nucleotide--dimethylbenzimidazole phosphoribosyltransferase n=1 Tax=Treponema endosymbiont of Eucomonympha sp. TaxID=1580831 RepID=UPI000AFF90DB|nr:nicotinate-nucleotide--dimethylbenzimidazole phosphoribosyltransferase [Treponema endosymbiont of Eucomonympha sp.]
MARIQSKSPPERGVFAGDHGIAAKGVSLYPQEVLRQMTLNKLAGDAGAKQTACRRRRERGYDLAATDDLGTDNTNTEVALIAAGFDARDMVDRGTVIADEMLEHKRWVVAETARTREAILEQVGSCDFAMMTGFMQVVWTGR